MAILTAVLLATTCHASTNGCETYRMADFYGKFEQVGQYHCAAMAEAMNAAPTPRGSSMHYQCVSPNEAAVFISADLDAPL